MVIKMSKMAHLLYFFAGDSKQLVMIWEKYLVLSHCIILEKSRYNSTELILEVLGFQ